MKNYHDLTAICVCMLLVCVCFLMRYRMRVRSWRIWYLVLEFQKFLVTTSKVQVLLLLENMFMI